MLTLLYIGLFAFFIPKIRFFRDSGLSTPLLLFVFILKVIAGVLYGWIHVRYYGGDTLTYIAHSRLIYESFFENPLYFLRLTLGPNGGPEPEHLKHILAPLAWSDGRAYMMLRINAFIHFFSGGSYNVHVVFWCFFSLFGLVGIYRTLIPYFQAYKNRLLLGIFFVPSVLFWGSGVNKGGITLLAMGMLLFHFQQYLAGKQRLKRLFWGSIFAALLFMVRPYVALLLLPALAIWSFNWQQTNYLGWRFIGGYGLFWIIVVGLNALSAHIELFAPFAVLERLVFIQHYYVLESNGYGDFPMPLLEPNWWSFIQGIPQAGINTIFRPTLWEGTTLPRMVAAIETLSLLFLTIACLLFSNTQKFTQQQACILYFCLFFTITFLLFVGLLIDNCGSIVRYRMVILPFWVSGMLFLVEVKEL